MYTIEAYDGAKSLERCITRKPENSTLNTAISRIPHNEPIVDTAAGDTCFVDYQSDNLY